MAQHDYVIDNGGGATVRSDINAALQAILTSNSGTTAPTVTKPFMLWFDTTAVALKIRNAADTAWVLYSDFVVPADGSITTAKLVTGEQMTTTNVLNATASATAGAVGTYMFAAFFGSSLPSGLAVGSTTSGSNLKPGTVYNDSAFGSSWTGSISGSALTGTWRLMGALPITAGTATALSLWLRIA